MARLADRFFTRASGREVHAFTVDRAFGDDDEYLGRPLVAFEDLERFFPRATSMPSWPRPTGA